MTKEDTNDDQSDATLKPVSGSIETVHVVKSPIANIGLKSRKNTETLEMGKNTNESIVILEVVNQ